MESDRHRGRIIGALILLHMVGSGIVNFALEAPLGESPGFMVTAALHSRQLVVAVVLGIATEALWLGIAVTAFTIVYPRSQRLALWFLALAGVILATAIVENIGVMSMLSLSDAFAKTTAADRNQFEASRVIIVSIRDWAHFMTRIVHAGAMFAFYALLFRCALIPRALAGFGLIAAVLMATGVGLPLFGYDVVFALLMPMALSQLLLSIWLIAKGFDHPVTVATI